MLILCVTSCGKEIYRHRNNKQYDFFVKENKMLMKLGWNLAMVCLVSIQTTLNILEMSYFYLLKAMIMSRVEDNLIKPKFMW